MQTSLPSNAQLTNNQGVTTPAGDYYQLGSTSSSATTSSQTTTTNNTDKTSKKKYKILMVEDELHPQIVFKTIIEMNPDYEVLVADDGTTCLAILEQHKNFDLVLLDIVMPTKDGIQTLTEIKQSPEKYGSPKVVMLSNLGGDVAFETARKIGAVDFWMKIDTEPTQLLSKINDVLTNPNYQAEADISNRII